MSTTFNRSLSTGNAFLVDAAVDTFAELGYPAETNAKFRAALLDTLENSPKRKNGDGVISPREAALAAFDTIFSKPNYQATDQGDLNVNFSTRTAFENNLQGIKGQFNLFTYSERALSVTETVDQCYPVKSSLGILSDVISDLVHGDSNFSLNRDLKVKDACLNNVIKPLILQRGGSSQDFQDIKTQR